MVLILFGARSETAIDDQFFVNKIESDMFHHGLHLLTIAICAAFCLVVVCGDNREKQLTPCPLCKVGILKNMTVAEAPALYHKVKGGGDGAFIYSMLHACAYAASRGWVYGGPLEPQKVDGKLISFFFNTDEFVANSKSIKSSGKMRLHQGHASDLDNLEGPPWVASIFTVEVDDWVSYEKKCPTEPFPRFRYKDQVNVLDSIFTPAFLKTLQSSNKPQLDRLPLVFTSKDRKAPRVAIHIRRGALVKGGFSTRKHTLDAYYYSVVEIIRDKYPKAEIHAWPTLGKRGDAPAYNTSHFEGYTRRNIVMHYDMPVRETWAHMISADILVMAHSVYSSVPALLNPNCVVYDHFWLGKMARHLTLHNLKDKINECYKP